MPPIRIGRLDGPAGVPDKIFLVHNGERPFVRVELHAYRDDYHGFESCTIWSHFLVVGAGHRVYFVDLRDGGVSEFDLDGYFGSLAAGHECLLVASAQRLFSFDRDAALQWRSHMLGLDGVVIDRITSAEIAGAGEWDPPGGWKPFRVSAASGADVSGPA